MNDIINKIKRNSLLEKTLKLALISTCSNFFGFLIPLFIAYKYKISKETDDFFLCYSIIIFIGTMFSTSVKSVSIPFLKEKSIDSVTYTNFISSIYWFIIKYLGIATIIVFIILITVYKWYDQTLCLYLLLSTPIVFMTILNSFSYGILNSIDQYYLAETTPLTRALFIFFSIYISPESFGMTAVIIGYNIGELVKFFHLMYIIKWKNNINISLPIKDLNIVKSFIKEGSYQIISATIVSMTPLVDRIVASFLISGSVSTLDYGDKIYMMFNVLLNSFLVIILSKWSKDYINGEFRIEKINKAMITVFSFSTLLLISVLITKGLIVDILYPNISANSRSTISHILLLNMIGFLFNSVSQVINRATIVLRLTRIMIVIASARLLSNIVLDTLLAKYWGLFGIAYSAIVVHIIGFSVNYYMFRKRSKLFFLNIKRQPQFPKQ